MISDFKSNFESIAKRKFNAILKMAGKSAVQSMSLGWETSVKCTFIMLIVKSALEQLEQKAYLTQ